MSAPESPPAVLRRAASLVRERAEKATPGPWRAHEQRGDWYVSSVEWGQVTTGINEDPAVADHVLIERDRADAEHVAGMDPLVGLPLADLLEAFASCECDEDDDHYPQKSAALKVARAVLGEAEADVEAEEPGDDGEYELAAILARHPGATFPELARAVLADGRFGKLDGAR